MGVLRLLESIGLPPNTAFTGFTAFAQPAEKKCHSSFTTRVWKVFAVRADSFSDCPPERR
jgi:hypothetical protein